MLCVWGGAVTKAVVWVSEQHRKKKTKRRKEGGAAFQGEVVAECMWLGGSE